MPDDKDELNLKMLERCAEQFGNDRHDFFRDLKIVAPLLMVFQFFVFFRFADLTEDQQAVSLEISRVQTHHAALTNVQTRVIELKETLDHRASSLLKGLEKVPPSLRSRIQELEKGLKEFRSLPDPLAAGPDTGRGGAATAEAAFPAAQTSIQYANAPFGVERGPSRPRFPFLAGLTTNDLSVLHRAPFQDSAFRALVDRLVVQTAIEPEFEHLNEQWQSGLAVPFGSNLASLLARTNDLVDLERAGFPSVQLATNGQAIHAALVAYRFKPPDSPNWWKTYDDKTGTSRDMQLDARRTTDDLNQSLSASAGKLSQLKASLDKLLTDTIRRQQGVEAELLKLQTNAASLQSLLQSYATPIPYLTLEPREFVLYFPVILAAFYVVFAIRQVRLHRRLISIVAVYRARGLTNEILHLGFERPDPPAPIRLALSVLWGLPLMLAGAGIHRILTTTPLRPAAPHLLYFVAVAMLIAAYVVLLRMMFRRAHD